MIPNGQKGEQRRTFTRAGKGTPVDLYPKAVGCLPFVKEHKFSQQLSVLDITRAWGKKKQQTNKHLGTHAKLHTNNSLNVTQATKSVMQILRGQVIRNCNMLLLVEVVKITFMKTHTTTTMMIFAQSKMFVAPEEVFEKVGRRSDLLQRELGGRAGLGVQQEGE